MPRLCPTKYITSLRKLTANSCIDTNDSVELPLKRVVQEPRVHRKIYQRVENAEEEGENKRIENKETSILLMLKVQKVRAYFKQWVA